MTDPNLLHRVHQLVNTLPDDWFFARDIPGHSSSTVARLLQVAAQHNLVETKSIRVNKSKVLQYRKISHKANP